MIVKKITSTDCKRLRHIVLWPHILHEKDCIIDIDEQEDAIHLGAVLDGQIISICSLFKTSNPALELPGDHYRLRAMATHPNFRGKSAGRAVVLEAINILKANNTAVLWCDAREVALEFYSKLGFSTKGDFYNVKNIGPHKLMYYEL